MGGGDARDAAADLDRRAGELEPRDELVGPARADPAQHFDLRGHYSIADSRFDLSEAPVELVSERPDGLTFRLTGGTRLVVTWTPKVEGDLV